MMKYFIKIFALSFILICVNIPTVRAQFWASYDRRDSSYIKLFPHKYTVRPFFIRRTLNLRFMDIDPERSEKNIAYEPNAPLQIGLFAAYKRTGIGAAIALPTARQSIEQYGKSNTFDLELNFYSRRIVADAGYFSYKGFYVSNPGEIYPDYQPQDPFPRREDLGVRGFRFNAIYLFNYKKFSLKASFQQLEYQSRSAGSFLLMFSGNYSVIRSDSALVPFDFNNDFVGGKFISLALAPGYGYVFKLKKWSVNPVLFLGPAFQGNRIRTETEQPFKIKGLGGKLHARFGVHYDSGRFFTGAFFIFDTVSFMAGNVRMNQTQSVSTLFAGYRF